MKPLTVGGVYKKLRKTNLNLENNVFYVRSKSGKRALPENQLVYEWVKMNFPNALQWRRVRMGAMPEGVTNAAFGVLRRFADLVVFDGKTVHIIEAKMTPQADALGQLELYAMLWPETP